MAVYSQADRPLAIFTPLQQSDALVLEGFRGRTAISELFRFELDFVAPLDVSVPFNELLGQAVKVRLRLLEGRVPQFYHGIVSRLRLVARDQTFTRYRAELVPSLWLLTRTVQSRSFQTSSLHGKKLTVPNILAKVFESLAPNVRFDLREPHPARKNCIQYNESAFAFASRLMEEEGLYYFFQHEQDRHVLVVVDSPSFLPDLPGEAVLIQGARSEAVNEYRAFEWQKEQEVRAGSCTLWDQSFELTGLSARPKRPPKGQPLNPADRPFKSLEARRVIRDAVTVGSVSHPLRLGPNRDLEIYEYPGGHAKRFDSGASDVGETAGDFGERTANEGNRVARLRMELEAVRGLRVEGASNAGHLLPGHCFQLQGHADDVGRYAVTAVEHDARLTGYRTGETGAFAYENRFWCIPAELPFRPERRTPRPILHGPQTAVVVGLEGDEVCTDVYGRVKVQFHWDREGSFDPNSSCWVRVSQVWAGNRWGAFFWPRPGHEVVVAFEDGDPDRPLIIGSVYNEMNRPPLLLPDEADSCGFKSCSWGGDPLENFSCVIFHDRGPDEHVQIHSETHERITSERSKVNIVPGPSVQYTGSFPYGLPPLGSGAGGGAEYAVTSDAFDEGSGSGGGFGVTTAAASLGRWASGPASYFSRVFPGAYHVNGGEWITAFLGGRINQIFGDDVTVMCDPLDMLKKMVGSAKSHFFGAGKESGLKSQMFLGSVIGNGPLSLAIGSQNAFKYGGPILEVLRGEKITTSEPAFWSTAGDFDGHTKEEKKTALLCNNVVRVLTPFYVLVLMAGHIANRLLNTGQASSKVTLPVFSLMWTWSIVHPRLLGVIQAAENVYARLNASVKKVQDALQEVKRIKTTTERISKEIASMTTEATAASLGTLNSLTAATKTAQAELIKGTVNMTQRQAIKQMVILKEAENNLQAALARANEAAGQLAVLAGGDSEPANHVTQSYLGAHYMLNAGDVTLRAARAGGGNIKLQADGENGLLEMVGGVGVVVNCGETELNLTPISFQVDTQKDGLISLLTKPTIRLDLHDKGYHLQAENAHVRSEENLVSLLVNKGGAVNVTNDEVTLGCSGVKPSIVLGRTSIKLSVGETSSLELDAQGVTIKGLSIDMKATIQAIVDSLEFDQKVKAIVLGSGPLIKLGS